MQCTVRAMVKVARRVIGNKMNNRYLSANDRELVTGHRGDEWLGKGKDEM
jgi:hypothetical protein